MSNFTYSFNFNFSQKTAPVAVVFDGDSLEIRENAAAPEDALFIGELDGREVAAFCAPLDRGTELRAFQSNADGAKLSAVNRARQLLNHRERNRFCGRCGARTVLSDTEPAFACPACGAVYYARLDPAVIVAITRGDKLLLAHNSRFRPNLYGLIAGYIEGGESMEEAAAREVMEEVNVEVRNVRYFNSQFWPFPNSFMLGCFAEYAGGELKPDGDEITDAGFFSRAELPELPMPGSVARKIIDHWLKSF